MHGAVHGVSPQASGLYAPVPPVQTSEAQEAAATKRKLVRAAAEMGAEVSVDAAELQGQWKGSGSGPTEQAAPPEAGTEVPKERPYSWTASGQVVSGPATTGSVISYYA